MKLIHNSQTKNGLDGNCAVEEQPFGTVASCGIDLSKAMDFEPDYDSAMEPQNQPSVEFGEPLQDWFEMALKAETPVRAPAKNSWGEDEEEGEDQRGEDLDITKLPLARLSNSNDERSIQSKRY